MIVEESQRRIRKGKFIGGRICLDFANTVHNFGSANPEDDLLDYAAFISWAYQAGVLTQSETSERLRNAKVHPAQARAAISQIRNLRDSIFRTFSSASTGRHSYPTDLETINRILQTAILHSQIISNHSSFHRVWINENESLEAPLWPIAQSASELLLHPDLKHVRLCSGRNCTWLFIDQSKNHSRRWCEMSACGNREKSRLHYQQKFRQTHSD